MSNIYIQEPPTDGKILLLTSVGDIDIELWPKEAPKACRNFVQLCLEHYYDETIFHRVVDDFIVQGGDPTGTGTGGESIYGEPFKDEFHSRLRFVRRGLVAMANAGPNDNASQFFFTLGPAQELQNKHTIFGKVAGNTVYNMLKLGNVEVGEAERPLHPHKIRATKVLNNPFCDIIPREFKTKNSEQVLDKNRKGSKSRATKNFSLLSFGEEAEEDEAEVVEATKETKGKSKSSHDLTDDPRLTSATADQVLNSDTDDPDEAPKNFLDSREFLERKIELEEARHAEKNRIKDKLSSGKESKISKFLAQQKQKQEALKEKEVESKKKNISTDGKEMESKKAESGDGEERGGEEPTESRKRKQAVNDFMTERSKYKIQKKQPDKNSREAVTLAMMSKFTSRLKNVQHSSDIDDEDADKEDAKYTDLGWSKGAFVAVVNTKDLGLIKENEQELRERKEPLMEDPKHPLVIARREASKKILNRKGLNMRN